MNETRDFLFELGTEELPPSSLHRLAEALFENITSGITAAGLSFKTADYFATPRRLAVLISDLQAQQAPQHIERRGPAIKAAFNPQGEPTQAALGFAASCGCNVDQLSRVNTDKGDYLVFSETRAGLETPTLLPPILTDALNQLPIDKRMRWADHRYEFVRPVAWLVCLWGSDVIPFSAYGLQSQQQTRGHRVHAPSPIPLSAPKDYATTLREHGKVEPSLQTREALITQQIEQLAQSNGFKVVVEPHLLKEVTALTEWPVVHVGSFDESFLEVPQEALISSMQGHQKYFPVRSVDGTLINRFVFVANLESQNPALVIHGNETVIRPRLADAQFFWQKDCATPLADRVHELDQVVFHEKLGSLGDKVQRLVSLSTALAEQVQADAQIVARGALLAKADLVTDLVFEFTELQGIAGSYYAIVSGESKAVSAIVSEHYQPKFAGDVLPSSLEATLVAIADRLDTLIGIFAIGEKPTGARDPYALRRAALGLLRLIIENNLPFDLQSLFELTLAGYGDRSLSHRHSAIEEALQYTLERLRAWSVDQGYDIDVFLAVRALADTQPITVYRRLEAVQSFKSKYPDVTASLSASNKRVANILTKSGLSGTATESLDRLCEPAEIVLRDTLNDLQHQIQRSVEQQQFSDALTTIATLNAPLSEFFDQVMVMADDPVLRDQRLLLLQKTRAIFLQVVDFSLIQLDG